MMPRAPSVVSWSLLRSAHQKMSGWFSIWDVRTLGRQWKTWRGDDGGGDGEGYIQNSRKKFCCWGREAALQAVGWLWIWFKPCYQRSQAAHYFMKCILKGDYRCESLNANLFQQVQGCWLQECYKWFNNCFLTAATQNNKKSSCSFSAGWVCEAFSQLICYKTQTAFMDAKRKLEDLYLHRTGRGHDHIYCLSKTAGQQQEYIKNSHYSAVNVCFLKWSLHLSCSFIIWRWF